MAVVAASTCLTLAEVESELREVTAADWFKLGLQLGITPAKLKEIEIDHPRDAQRCKTEVLDWWHRNAQEISWKKLAEALEAMGGYVRLVERLDRSVTYALGIPFAIQMNGSSFHPELSQSSSPISNGHCHSGEAEGGNIYDDASRKTPLHGCKGVVSIYEPDLELETHFLRSKFNVLFTKVRRSLEQQGVKVDDFVSFLKGVPAYSAGEQSLFSAEFPRLYQKPTLTSVFDVVRDYTSWFNYTIVSDIVDAYCEKMDGIRKTLQEFQQLLQRYCKHRVCKCSLRNGFGFGRKRACAHMVLKIDKEWRTIRVELLEEVTSNLARILKVHRRSLYLYSVENGCVQLTFMLSNFLAAAIFPLSPDQEAQLTEIRVLLLHCGDYQFLNPPLVFEDILVTKKVDFQMALNNKLFQLWSQSLIHLSSYNLTAQLISCTELLLSSSGHFLELFHTGDEEMLSTALNLWVRYFFHPQSFLVSRISPKEPTESLNVWLLTSKDGRFNCGVRAPILAAEDEPLQMEIKDPHPTVDCIALPLHPATSSGSTSHQSEHPAERDLRRQDTTVHLDDAFPEPISRPYKLPADSELSNPVPAVDNLAGRGMQHSRRTSRGRFGSFMSQLTCGLSRGLVNVFSRNRQDHHPSCENVETSQVCMDEQSKGEVDISPNQQRRFLPRILGRKMSKHGGFRQRRDYDTTVARLSIDAPEEEVPPSLMEGSLARQNAVPCNTSSGLYSELPFFADENMSEFFENARLLTGSESPTYHTQLSKSSHLVTGLPHNYSRSKASSAYSVISHATSSGYSGSLASSVHSANSRATSSGYSGSLASSVHSANSRATSSGYSGSLASSVYSANSRATSSGYSGSLASSIHSAKSRGSSGYSGLTLANTRTLAYSGSHASSAYSPTYEALAEQFDTRVLHKATQYHAYPLLMTAIRDHNPSFRKELAVRKGQCVKVLYKKDDWVYAVTKTGKMGYIPFAFVRPSCQNKGKIEISENRRIPRSVKNPSDPPPLPSHPPFYQRTSIPDETLLTVMSCLMHRQNCQIPSCPCKSVQERYRELCRQHPSYHPHQHAAETCKRECGPNIDPGERKHQLHLNLSSQNLTNDTHPHYHLTTKSHIRHVMPRPPLVRQHSRSCDLTPTHEFPPDYSPVAPVAAADDGFYSDPTNEDYKPPYLREISISADNIPALCLNDCPLTPTPLKEYRTLISSPMRSRPRRWSMPKTTLKTVKEKQISTESSETDHSNTSSRSGSHEHLATGSDSEVHSEWPERKRTCSPIPPTPNRYKKVMMSSEESGYDSTVENIPLKRRWYKVSSMGESGIDSNNYETESEGHSNPTSGQLPRIAQRKVQLHRHPNLVVNSTPMDVTETLC